MAGIMKFFKPTDGGGGNLKKADRVPIGAATREPFSPMGNKDCMQHGACQQAEDNDSDVQIVGDDVSTGLKRKRADNRPAQTLPTTEGCSAMPGQRTSSATPGQHAQRPNTLKSAPENTPLNLSADGPDIELSSKSEREASTPAPAPQPAATVAHQAATSSDLVLSPPIEPTAKRQRLPHDTDMDASTASHQLPDQLPELNPQLQATSATAGASALLPPEASGGSPSAAPASSHLGAKPAQQPPAAKPHNPDRENDHTSLSQQSVDRGGGGGDGASGGGAAARGSVHEVGGGPPAAAGGEGGGSVAPGPANTGPGAKSGGAGPAPLPPDMDLGATLESLRAQQTELEAALEEEMLLDSSLPATAAASEGGRLALMPPPGELCVWLEGRTAPLSVLVGQLEGLLPAGTSPAALSTSLVDLAARRCYSAKEAPLDAAAASEDATPGRLWVWEVREPRRHLADKGVRKLVDLMRKRRKELRERLTAVGSAVEALAAHQALTAAPPTGVKPPSATARRTAESRAAKAWNRLSKLPDLQAVEAGVRSASAGLAPAVATGTAKKERKDKEEKARLREEHTRQREEEVRVRETKRAQEEEAKRKARETAAANKAGFTSKQGLRKSQNIMESFFKRSGPTKPPGAPPACGEAAAQGDATRAGDVAQAAAGSVSMGGCPSGPLAASTSSQQHQGQQGGGRGGPGGGPAGTSQPAATTPVRDCLSLFNFSKLSVRPPDPTVVSAMDSDAARLPLPSDQLVQELRNNHTRWRQQRTARKRLIGVPSTWARRPQAATDIRVLAAQYYGDVAALGLAPESLRTWRRKLLAFPRRESARPPFYGSFSRTSGCVTGRRPFGRDTTLDYEVASDEEWEEEPEGESLSDSGDEADSQAGGQAGEGGEDEDDGFIVGDDHLSDDEGAQLSGDPDDPMDVDGTTRPSRLPAGPPGAPPAGGGARFIDPRLQQLEAAIDRVRTNNRPILLVRPLQPTTATALPLGSTTVAVTPGRVPTAPTAATVPPAQGMSPAVAGAVTAAAASAPHGIVPSPLPAAAVQGAAVGGGQLHCLLRAEPRPGLNTGLDPGLLGALRPVVHRWDVALAPPLELDVFTVYAAAAAAGGQHGGGVGAGGGHGAGGAWVPGLVGAPGGLGEEGLAMAAVGGLPGVLPTELHTLPPGALLSAGPPVAPAAGGRVPGSGHRGRPPGAGLPAEALTALAEFMSSCGDLKMDKIVEGFLAGLPPGVKPYPKTKVREAIKRLGTWSAPGRRWILHGDGVAEAVAYALEAAAAAATAAAAVATPPGAAAVVAARGLGALATPPPVSLHGMAGLPAPTPAPRLGGAPSALPTPTTAPGNKPLLHAPACTPMDATAAPHRPMGQHLLPHHLAHALARLAAAEGAAPAASPLPSATHLPAAAVTPASVVGPPQPPPAPHAAVPPDGSIVGGAPVVTPPREGSGILDFSNMGGGGSDAGADTGAGQGADVAANNGAHASANVACAGGDPSEGGDAATELDKAAGAGTATVATDAAQPPVEAPRAVAAENGADCEMTDCDKLPSEEGGPPAPDVRQRGDEQAATAPSEEVPPQQQMQLDGLEAAAGGGLQQGTSAPVVGAEEEEAAGGLENGDVAMVEGDEAGGNGPEAAGDEAAATGTGLAAAEGGAAVPETSIARPMPPPPPPLEELSLLGTAHPFWTSLSCWVLGGGGEVVPDRPGGGATWTDVSAALRVFEAGVLEPRLGAVPLDVVRALLAVCQHRRSSHLRSGAFKALANLAAALAATAATGGDAVAAGAGGGVGGERPLQGGTGRGRRVVDAATGAACSAASADCDAGNSAPESDQQQALQRPTGQPSRCSPQPASLLALWRLPGLLAALRRGCCQSTLDSESDKAARGAARVLAALVGVGIPPLSSTAPFAKDPAPQQPPLAAAPGVTECSAVCAPKLMADASSFRLRVVTDPDLHAALRNAALKLPDTASPSAYFVFHAHMLLALQRLLRDPEAATHITKTKARLAKERAAAASGKPPPPPLTLELQGKWAAKMLQSLVAGARDLPHAGCRKGVVQCTVALLGHPRLVGAMKPEGQAHNLPGVDMAGALSGGSSSLAAILTGNDPRAQLPAVCLSLLTAELRHVAGGAMDEERKTRPEPIPTTLDKCGRARVTIALHVAERALRHLALPTSRLQLQQADTKAAVAEVLTAMGEASEVLSSLHNPAFEILCTIVGTLAQELA